MEIKITLRNEKEIMRYLETRPQKMKEELNRAVKKSVFAIERQTKIYAPVRTGRLRSSVRSRSYDLKGEVGVGVRYAIFVELGTRYFGGRYFLTRAIKTMTRAIQSFFKTAVKNTLKK